eukprot:scaffold20121_cov23-Phaeocystis_antarctica.AAC.1
MHRVAAVGRRWCSSARAQVALRTRVERGCGGPPHDPPRPLQRCRRPLPRARALPLPRAAGRQPRILR